LFEEVKAQRRAIGMKLNIWAEYICKTKMGDQNPFIQMESLFPKGVKSLGQN
jgi:hypothetical protein